jgi:hypothetical protein
MNGQEDLARGLIVGGLVLAALGVLWLVLGRAGLGRLPGDFAFEWQHVKVYIPLATSIILSLLLTVLLNLFLRR